MTSPPSLRTLAILGALHGLATTCPAHDIRVSLYPPGGGILAWGLLEDGREIATGTVPTRRFTLQSGIPNAFIAEAPDFDPTKAELWLTINTDGLVSYLPSVGDWFLRTTVRCDEEGPTDGRPACEADAHTLRWQTLTLADPDALLTVHYHRLDGEYAGASLWTWDERLRRAPADNELLPVGRDDFGLIFQIDTSLYGEKGDGIGLLPRRHRDWQHKDGGDRLWRPDLGHTVYLVQDDDRLYAERPDVSPKVRRVTLDAEHHLTVRFSHRLPVAEWTPGKFAVESSTGEQMRVVGVYPFSPRGETCAMYSVQVEQPLEFPNKAYALTIDGFGTFNVEIGHIVKDAKRFYDPDVRLGATYTPAATTFRVFAPGALAAHVVIADAPDSDAGLQRIDMFPAPKGIWVAEVKGDLAGKYYAYALGGIGFDLAEEITDIYATCTQGKHRRSLIADLKSTDPPGFREQACALPASPADAVIYEMHVRDFTIAENSGVKMRGKYLGLTEAGTTLPDDKSIRTGLDHLVEMGVTHVQLMPVQDFDNGDELDPAYNWGYMPVHFNSPDGWFASTPAGEAKIRELKSAIQALHARGIGVILDVVYNHTAGHAPFEKLVPGYYFRLTDSGNFSNGSGCGNEFASENPMARKFLLDSLKFWVEEYRVDGFRFDLMGLIDLETMKLAKAELEKINPRILVYGEPWAAGPTPLKPVTDKSQVRGTGVGAFNDGFRDAIKGDRDGGPPGFIQVGDRVEGVVKGLMGAIHDWAQDPVDSLNYFEAHDNLTTWDKLLQSAPHVGDGERLRMLRFAALTLFTSQGTIFMHSGQEFGRSKKGSHNSYNLPDEYNQIDWSLKKQNLATVQYHQGLIALRKAHPIFRLRTRAEVEKRVHFATPPDPRFIMYELDGTGLDGESAERVLVYLNGASHPVTCPLPAGRWRLHADADRASPDPLGEARESLEIPPHSGVILMREKK